jgi:hypothetical protein
LMKGNRRSVLFSFYWLYRFQSFCFLFSLDRSRVSSRTHSWNHSRCSSCRHLPHRELLFAKAHSSITTFIRGTLWRASSHDQSQTGQQ